MDVLLYVLDSLRSDFLGCYDDDESETSPTIDTLAEDGVVFENAYATASWTKASAASILTGEYHSALNMTERFNVLPENILTLPERLQSKGFGTYGVSANTFISGKFGFTDGFTAFKDLQEYDLPNRKTTPAAAVDTDLVVPQAKDLNDFLFDIVGNDEDRFLFIWSVDTHDPYFVRGDQSHFGNTGDEYIPVHELNSYAKKHGIEKLKSLYRDMIRYNDKHISNLFDRLKEAGRYEDALIIVTGDHGESFGEHGEIGHAGPVFQEQVKVPLVVKFPNRKFAGERIKTPVSLVDLVPTVLSIVGADNQETPDGHPLQETVHHGDRDSCVYASSKFNIPHSEAFWWKDYKYLNLEYALPKLGDSPKTIASRLLDIPNFIRWHRPSIFDLERDPTEQTPLSVKQEPDAMQNARERLAKSIKERSRKRPTRYWDPNEEKREQTRDRLKHLGYLE